MKIGIIKFGLCISERFDKNEGSNFEIINFVDIMEKEHECFVISRIKDKQHRFKVYNGEELDIIFVFNGPISRRNDQLMILNKYTLPHIKFLNEHKCPWVYMNTDIRYNLNKIKPSELIHKPTFISYVCNEDNATYYHHDKFVLYNKKPGSEGFSKDIFFGVLMNDTNPARTKKALNFVENVSLYSDKVEIVGKWKTPNRFLREPINELLVSDYLKNVKYTINIATNPQATSQKLWEYIENDVICFLYDYDLQYNMIPANSYLRVRNVDDMIEKINYLERNRDKYIELIEEQRSMLLPSYINGEFLLNKYNKLIEKLCTTN